MKSLIAALRRVTAKPPFKWSGDYDDDDLNDAIDHINLQRNRNMEKGLSEIEFTEQKMVDPAKLLSKRAFEGKQPGWLRSIPSNQWDEELKKIHEDRDFSHIFEQAQAGINDVIVIEGEVGDGYGRIHLAYALGEKVSVSYFEMSDL